MTVFPLDITEYPVHPVEPMEDRLEAMLRELTEAEDLANDVGNQGARRRYCEAGRQIARVIGVLNG